MISAGKGIRFEPASGSIKKTRDWRGPLICSESGPGLGVARPVDARRWVRGLSPTVAGLAGPGQPASCWAVGRVGQAERGGTRISVWVGYQDGGGWWVGRVGQSDRGKGCGVGWGGGGTRITVWGGYQGGGGWIEWDSQTGGTRISVWVGYQEYGGGWTEWDGQTGGKGVGWRRYQDYCVGWLSGGRWWVGRVRQSERGEGGWGWGGGGTRISVWVGYQENGGGWLEGTERGEGGGGGWGRWGTLWMGRGGGGTRISVWFGY